MKEDGCVCWAMDGDKLVSLGLSGLLWPTPYHGLPTAEPLFCRAPGEAVCAAQDSLAPEWPGTLGFKLSSCLSLPRSWNHRDTPLYLAPVLFWNLPTRTL